MRVAGIFPRLRGHFVAAAVLCLASPAGAAEPWPAQCKLELAASLPFSIKAGHIRVAVRVNDVPRNFIIDTGGLISSVTERVVESQGLKTHPISEHISITGIGGQKAERYAVADTLSFARLRAKDVHLMVQPNPDGSDEDGVIGPDYLRNFDMEFDFANQILNLFRPHPCADHTVYWTDQFTALPMDVTSQGHIRVRVTLDGEDFLAMVDTGAPATLIGARTAAAKFDIGPPAAGMTLSGVTGGSTFATLHRFHALQLGNITINNPPLLVSSDETAWRSDYSGILLGLRELSKFHLYIAYRGRTLYLSPNPPGQHHGPAN
jgi:predicted aspartyl protease